MAVLCELLLLSNYYNSCIQDHLQHSYVVEDYIEICCYTEMVDENWITGLKRDLRFY